jgi:hypothetical protein
MATLTEINEWKTAVFGENWRETQEDFPCPCCGLATLGGSRSGTICVSCDTGQFRDGSPIYWDEQSNGPWGMQSEAFRLEAEHRWGRDFLNRARIYSQRVNSRQQHLIQLLGEHELNIMTNDGWVVSLVSDREITLGDAKLRTIIVQPREDYNKRRAGGDNPHTVYHEVPLEKQNG